MKLRSTPVEPEYDALRDPNLDHLALSGETATIRRGARREIAKRRVINAIKIHGNGYSTASAALRSAAERHCGSWANACRAAGLEPPKRGRPRKGFQHHITLEPLDENGYRA